MRPWRRTLPVNSDKIADMSPNVKTHKYMSEKTKQKLQLYKRRENYSYINAEKPLSSVKVNVSCHCVF